MKKQSLQIVFLIISFVLIGVSQQEAQAQSRNRSAYLGQWSVKIEGIDFRHDILVVIKSGKGDRLIASYPAGGPQKLPDSPISMDGQNRISFKIPHSQDGVLFVGAMAEDAKKITGTCKMGNQEYACSLVKR